MGNEQELTQCVTASLQSQTFERPKSVIILTVDNGFTVTLEGGKEKKGELYRHSKLHVAKTKDEAIEIATDFLTA